MVFLLQKAELTQTDLGKLFKLSESLSQMVLTLRSLLTLCKIKCRMVYVCVYIYMYIYIYIYIHIYI